ncbi:hypothetical protein BJ741DRAFT_665794 [Chytriomyces cf. hyalinus JEL632]|nr:hypothetical protein BJ741DRAFT_665794 [Chytriomyces cf. hyalinus JEL632]
MPSSQQLATAPHPSTKLAHKPVENSLTNPSKPIAIPNSRFRCNSGMMDSIQPDQQEMPRGVCVKAYHLKPRGYASLADWLRTPGNVLVTRAGCLPFTHPDTGHEMLLRYKASTWANPFKISQYGLVKSLELYREHLEQLLARNPVLLREFCKLKDAKEIGCFCGPDAQCHRDILLQVLNTKLRRPCADVK